MFITVGLMGQIDAGHFIFAKSHKKILFVISHHNIELRPKFFD